MSKNDAEVCLNTTYPVSWVWQFTEDKEASKLSFDKKIKTVDKDPGYAFTCKIANTYI